MDPKPWQRFLPGLAVLSLLGTAFFGPTLAYAQAPPAVPALPDTERRTSYSISGTTCAACSVGFALYGDGTDYANWIEVWIITGSGTSAVATKLTAVTDYTLSSVTGSLASIPRPITNATITLTASRTGTLQIVGARRPRRTSQFAENRGVAARDLNQTVTDLVAENRELWDKMGRALIATPSDSIGPLPVAAVRAGGIMAFDISGNPTIMAAGSSGTANVVGPNVSTVGHIATYGNTTGTLLLDGGLIGTGDFVGPAGAATDHVMTFASVTGKVGKDSGLTLTPSTGTFTLTNGKTLAVSNTLTFTGTDGSSVAFGTGGTATYTSNNLSVFAATTSAQLAGVLSDETGSGAAVFATSPTISTPTITAGTLAALTGFALRDTSAAFDLTIAATSTSAALTAGRTLTLDAGNVAHTVQFGTTANTITFPNVASDTVAMLAASQTLTNKTLSGAVVNGLTITASGSALTIANNKTVTISNTLTFAGTDGTTQTFQGTDTIVGRATTDTLTNKTLTAPTINGGTAQALTNLGIRSTGSGAFDMVIANTENLTAQRTLTLTLNNAARLISLSGDLTLGVAFTANGSGPITINSSSSTNITLPTSGTLATRDVSNTFSATNTFSALNQFSDAKFSSGKLYPTADSTTAMQVTKADGTTSFVNFDSTNKRVGINTTTPSADLQVSGTIAFTTLDATSLGGSPTTITGLTLNNSPNAANDYLLYYNAASGAIRKATLASVTAAGTAGVSSLNGLTGGLSIVAGNGISVSAASTSVTITSTGTLIPQGRLTLTTGVAVMRANTTAVSTIYYDNYTGNQVPIYNGSIDVGMAINAGEISDVVPTSSTGVANSAGVFDMWAINVSGTLTLCHATNGSGGGWASDTAGSNTARGTGYSQLDFTSRAYITNKNALTHCYNGSTDKGSISANQATYLGTFYTTAAGQTGMNFTPGATGGGNNSVLGLYNAYNRERMCVSSYDSTSSWTTTAAAWEVANIGGTGVGLNNRVNWIDGLAQSLVDVEFDIIAAENSGTGFVSNGISFDGTGTPTGQTASFSGSSTSNTSMSRATNTIASAGFHFAQAMQKASNGKWFGVGDVQAMMVRACLNM